MNIVEVSPEAVPFAKTGGLADVVGSLPLALEKQGAQVRLVLPAYSVIPYDRLSVQDTGIRFSVPVSNRQEPAEVLQARVGKAGEVFFIKADRYFRREYLYSTPEGDYADNAERFVFFSRAVLELLRRIGAPDILHCHDWQTALVPVFLKTQPSSYPELASVRTLMTIHNLGYQGVFWHLDWHLLNLPWEYFNARHLEFYEKINFLKGGMVFADAISTVSKKYAEEIRTAEQGFGLEGVLQERSSSLYGILNGVDDSDWNPETDSFIARHYSKSDISGKKECKRDLQQICGFPQAADVPLLGVISRLADQKGFDLLAPIMEDLMGLGVQFVLLGTGEKKYHDLFEQLQKRHSRGVRVFLKFDNSLAHKIEAGADLFLMPSRYEPCGLNQMYSLKYGTVPVVRATGGLDDTVQELDSKGTGNGFRFSEYSAQEFLATIRRALDAYRRPDVWGRLVANGMSADHSWERSAKEYLDLFRRLRERSG